MINKIAVVRMPIKITGIKYATSIKTSVGPKFIAAALPNGVPLLWIFLH
jgi:hypothetical protein